MRLEQFLSFIKENDLKNMSPGEAKMKFSESLGKRVLYRALALTAAEAEKVKTQGLESKLASGLRLVPEKDRRTIIFYNLYGNISSKLVSRTNPTFTSSSDPLMSLSEIPEVAIAVSKQYLSSQKQIYLFKAEIPEIELLSLYSTSRLFKPQFDFSNKKIVLRKGWTSQSSPLTDPKVESFIFYKIFPDEIKDVRIVNPSEVPSLSWAG